VKVFRNLVEAINSLGRGKVLFSTDEFLFNKKLAFYQKDVFENLYLDKYKMNYGEVGAHILIRYFYSNGIDLRNDFHGLSSLTSEKFMFIRSRDFLGLSEKLAQHVSSLDYLKEDIGDFIQSSGKYLSRLTDSYDYLLFSRFRSESVVTPQLFYGEGKKWINSISRFWKNLVFGDSEVYDKFLSVFDGELRKYVAKTVSLSEPPSGYDSFSLPFGYFDRGTRPLAFEGNSVGGGVSLFSYNSALSSDRISYDLPKILISKGYYTPEEKYGDFFPEILGCFDFYFNIDKDEDVVIIPVESEYEDGEKTLILHTFYVATLLDDHFKFYVDGRKKASKDEIDEYWSSEYKFNLYPNQKDDGKGKVVIDVEERIGVDLTWADKERGVEELRLEAELLMNVSSFGEIVEVGSDRSLVPRGARITKDGGLYIKNFYVKLNPSTFDYVNFDLDKFVVPNWDKNLSDTFVSILEKVEEMFMSNLPGFDFVYRRSRSLGMNSEEFEHFTFRDKRFLLSTIELVFRESVKAIKKASEDRGVYSYVGGTASIKDTRVRKTNVFSTSNSFNVKIPYESFVKYQSEVFEKRKPYPKFIDYLDPNLCLDFGSVSVNVDFPYIYDKKVRDLVKIKSYRAFVDKYLPENDLGKDQVEVYSLFLDLVPNDPSSVNYLYSKGLHEVFLSKGEIGKRIMESSVDPLDLGVVYTKWGVEIEISVGSCRKDKSYCVAPKYRYRIGDNIYEYTFINDLINQRFEYKIGKNAIEILRYYKYLTQV
jgi:hypothetical protein